MTERHSRMQAMLHVDHSKKYGSVCLVLQYHIGSLPDLWLVADNQVLSPMLRSNVVCHPASIAGVQGAVYLIKKVERGGKGSLKGKGEGKSGKCLLATTQGPKWPAVMSVWPTSSQVICHVQL